MDDIEGASDVFVRMDDVWKLNGRVDWDIVNATTEADRVCHKAEDGDPDLGTLGPPRVVDGRPFSKRIRAKFGLSQEEFAERFGIAIETLQQWEDQRHIPDGPARLLLRIIEQEPEIVARIVAN